MSLLLAATWLALSHSLALVHLLSALLLAWLVPRLVHPFLGTANRVHWPVPASDRVVLYDIVVSNITVAKLVLGPMDKPQPRPGCGSARHRAPMVNSLFATIITTTPGTVSAVVDEALHVIWVHALDCSDAQAMAQDMKSRYEAPLMDVSRCSDCPGRRKESCMNILALVVQSWPLAVAWPWCCVAGACSKGPK
jgi:multicomponent K+:H+ antiporter subunit E